MEYFHIAKSLIIGISLFSFSIFIAYDISHKKRFFRYIKNKLFYQKEIELIDVKINKIQLIKADNESFFQKRKIKQLQKLDFNLDFNNLQSIIVDGEYLIFYEEISNNEDFKINIKGQCTQMFVESDNLSIGEKHFLKKEIFIPKNKSLGNIYYESKIIDETAAFNLMH